MSFLPGCSQGFPPWLYLGFRSVILMCLGWILCRRLIIFGFSQLLESQYFECGKCSALFFQILIQPHAFCFFLLGSRDMNVGFFGIIS